jgi:hypothetical protein
MGHKNYISANHWSGWNTYALSATKSVWHATRNSVKCLHNSYAQNYEQNKKLIIFTLYSQWEDRCTNAEFISKFVAVLHECILQQKGNFISHNLNFCKDLRFSRRWLRRMPSSGILNRSLSRKKLLFRTLVCESNLYILAKMLYGIVIEESQMNSHSKTFSWMILSVIRGIKTNKLRGP